MSLSFILYCNECNSRIYRLGNTGNLYIISTISQPTKHNIRVKMLQKLLLTFFTILIHSMGHFFFHYPSFILISSVMCGLVSLFKGQPQQCVTYSLVMWFSADVQVIVHNVSLYISALGKPSLFPSPLRSLPLLWLSLF